MVKCAAAKAGINAAVSPHWLRHAHGSHAIERGASLPQVQATPRTRQYQHDVVTCTHAPTARAGYASIRECFFDEDED
jgi:site-specific recombinase XerC